MKIAIPTLLTRKVEKVTYGGTEALVYNLVEQLVKRGNDVTLYASSDSQTSATLRSIVSTETARLKIMGFDLSTLYYLLVCNQIVTDAKEYDIIHDNLYMFYFLSAFALYIDKPIVHTVHNAFFQNPDFKKVLSQFGKNKNEHMVFVSDFGKHLAGDPANASVIYNGIDTSYFSFSLEHEEYALWFGRMVPEKGAKVASEAMQHIEKPFVINFPQEAKKDEAYWDVVQTYLGDTVKIVDTKQDEKIALYQRAKMLLFTSVWEEPFGLVMGEAMSCGTPVIAYAKGATPEIIVDGETGFLVNPSEDDMRGDFLIKKTGVPGIQEAIEKIYALSSQEYEKMRLASRKRVEENFSVEKMVDNYEALYKRLIISQE